MRSEKRSGKRLLQRGAPGGMLEGGSGRARLLAFFDSDGIRSGPTGCFGSCTAAPMERPGSKLDEGKGGVVLALRGDTQAPSSASLGPRGSTCLLESRLDALVYRAKFVPTIFAARQFVNHGHIRVNGKKVNIPSYQVQDGDVIEVKEKSCELPLVLEAIASTERDLAEYMDVDLNALKGTFIRGPKLADVPYPVQMEPNLVVEYYSL